jgi:hypothetical protein
LVDEPRPGAARSIGDDVVEAILVETLEIATGKVITDIRTSHTSADLVAFLNKVNGQVPAELDVHVILDNPSGS